MHNRRIWLVLTYGVPHRASWRLPVRREASQWYQFDCQWCRSHVCCLSGRHQFPLSVPYRCCTSAAVTLITFSYCRCTEAAITSTVKRPLIGPTVFGLTLGYSDAYPCRWMVLRHAEVQGDVRNQVRSPDVHLQRHPFPEGPSVWRPGRGLGISERKRRQEELRAAVKGYVCVNAWDPLGPLGLYSHVTSN